MRACGPAAASPGPGRPAAAAAQRPPPGPGALPATSAPAATEDRGAGASSLVAVIESFLGCVKLLLGALGRKYPHDPLVDRLRKRINLAADICPTGIIEYVGSHLYPYREQIYGEDDAFFLNNAFTEEFTRATDSDKVAIAAHLVPLLKQAWRESADEERSSYTEAAQSLLDDYIEYLSLQIESGG